MIILTEVPVGTLLRHLNLVGFIYVPVRGRREVSNWSFFDVPVETSESRLSMVQDVQIGHYTGSNSFGYWAVRLFGISGSSVSLRYQLVRRYKASKTSVSFRYQIWHLCDVLSWSVSHRYQLVCRYDDSNRPVISTYQWDIGKDVSNRSVSFTYQLWRCDDVSAWSAMIRPIWDLTEASLRPRMPGGTSIFNVMILEYVMKYQVYIKHNVVQKHAVHITHVFFTRNAFSF